MIRVRDVVARGYFILGGASQRGGGSESVVPCRSLSDLDSGRSPVMPHPDGFGIGKVTLAIVHTLLHKKQCHLNGHSRLASCNKLKT